MASYQTAPKHKKQENCIFCLGCWGAAASSAIDGRIKGRLRPPSSPYHVSMYKCLSISLPFCEYLLPCVCIRSRYVCAGKWCPAGAGDGPCSRSALAWTAGNVPRNIGHWSWITQSLALLAGPSPASTYLRHPNSSSNVVSSSHLKTNLLLFAKCQPATTSFLYRCSYICAIPRLHISLFTRMSSAYNVYFLLRIITTVDLTMSKLCINHPGATKTTKCS
jgi:hypothetical protein